MRASLNVLSSFTASAWAALIGLLVLPTYLRYLGVESFGLVGFMLTLQAWFALLDLGLSPTTSREMARFTGGQHSAQGIRDLFSSLESVYALVALLLAMLLVISSRWLTTEWLQLRSLGTEQAVTALSLMAAMVAIQWMATLYRSAINGLQRQVWLSGVTIALSTLRALVTLAVLAWVSPTLNAFVLAQAASFLIEAVVMRWYLQRCLPPVRGRFSPAALKAVWHFAAGITAISLLATLLNQVDKLLLARLLPLEQFGYFSLSVTVIGALSIVVTPVFNAAYPRLAELVASGRESQLADEYHAFSQMAAMTILPIAATLTLFSSPAVYAWTGDRQLTAYVAPIVAVWAVGSALNGLMHVPYALQLAVGWVRLSIGLNILAVAALVPAILLLVPRYGAVAAGWIWTAVNFFYFTAGVFIMHRRVLRGELASWYVRDIGAPGTASVGVMLVGWAVQSWLEPLDRTESAVLVAGTLVGALLMAVCSTPTGRQFARAAIAYATSRLALGRQ